jgi:polysaccharide export outer membrane protein
MSVRPMVTRITQAALLLASLILLSALSSGSTRAQSPQPEKALPSPKASVEPTAAPASAAAPSTSADAADEDPGIYRIGPEDQLQISVWHEPELGGAPVVRPDGKITLPLIGDVYVIGQTPDELQVLLTKDFKQFVNDPQVTVIPQQIRSRKVSLVGQVVRQGTYPLNGRVTVVQLIAEGGGLGQFARAKSIYILRKKKGQEIKIAVNYKEAVKGRGDNPILFPGDMVVVP